MLNAKNPGQPIAAMAKTMRAIFLEAPGQFSHSLEQLHGVIAECFIATRGPNDLTSLGARQEALMIVNDHEVSISEIESILEIYSDLLDKAIGLFREDSQEAMTIKSYCINAMGLNCVAWLLWELARFHDNADNVDSHILDLKECICILKYMHRNVYGRGTWAVASEVRLDMAGSGYLREVVDNDECNSFEV
ncbi:LOW QUALITY PROTEIN: uncharacterized protein LY79DRAFT_648918 [Colletotrichum navitas]|uniref:Uncharacterized protein n=1 Tax=Colletotrichum navitas TaxID=681940 RepID=A0AAD8Q2E2_9PEZI|nr:LOW QUALITY PROTEIN: uncharacterized protein LY79DRAFT_648918 [Colletotrichum navitas]KAK1594160.1 LOW QUALITY PROTEIN: hypothetical protein LY79DRAFT_648918 [Colletotrichum navitas]